jgi:hypothetical protein
LVAFVVAAAAVGDDALHPSVVLVASSSLLVEELLVPFVVVEHIQNLMPMKNSDSVQTHHYMQQVVLQNLELNVFDNGCYCLKHHSSMKVIQYIDEYRVNLVGYSHYDVDDRL